MRLLPGFKNPFFIRITVFVLILAFTWTTTAAGPAPPTAASANAKAQAVATPEKDKPKEEGMTPVAIAGKASETQATKKKFPWLIVIGAVVVVGVVAVVLLAKKKETAGKISVSSTPSAAKVFLDGSDTKKTTPCTLENVAAGSHTVKLTLDGYKDYAQTVTVTGEQTATVTASLTKHAITVSEPSGGSSKSRGVEIEIIWATDSNLMNKGKAAVMGLRLPRGGVAGPEGDESFTISAVNIDLYKAGTKVLAIAANTANDGTEKWTIPTSQETGSDYKVRVTCSTEATIYGESGAFSIVSQYGDIAVTSTPAGAKVWLDGTDTGQTTPCTLTNILRGTRHIKIEISYYGKWEGDIQVVESQTTNVNANLTPYAYEFVTAWGSLGSGDDQFNSPIGIAVDSSTNVYVADLNNHRILKFKSDGTLTKKWGSYGLGEGQFARPNGVAVDILNNVYVADTGNNRIQKFTPDGTFITTWGSTGTGEGQFNGPLGIGVDSSLNAYVVDANNHRIQKFAADKTFLKQWGGYGSGSGQLNTPWGICVVTSGHVYVTEYYNHRIQKFTTEGTYVRKWGSYGTGNGQLAYPAGIAWQSPGVVFVADYGNNRIQKSSDSGEYITQWGGRGTGNGQFMDNRGVAADSAGYIYVTDTANHRVQKFRYVTNAPPSVTITYAPIK